MQNELQEKVLNAMTLSEVRRCVHEHYRMLLTEVYKNTHPTTKVVVERVKNYIKDHFAEDLSIRELSEIACVSPNYFSHMVKQKYGTSPINYKKAILAGEKSLNSSSL